MTFGIRYSSCGPQKPNDWHHGSTSGYRDDDPRQRALGGDPLRTLADVELITADYVAWFGYAGDPRCVCWALREPARMLWAGGCRVHTMPGFARPMVVGFRVLGIGCLT